MATPLGVWIDVHFRYAYLMASRTYGADRFSARVDDFQTRDRTYQFRDSNNEEGWAATAAWRRDLSPRAALLAEVMHVSSDRPARLYQSLARQQARLSCRARYG